MIKEISFEEIYDTWETHLWKNRQSEIEPINGMMFMGGWDSSVLEKYKPVFFAYIQDHKIIGVNSGFQTSPCAFRSRGVYVLEEYRGYGIGERLIRAVTEYAHDNTSADIVWSIPRKEALYTYNRAGYHRIGPFFDEEMEFGPNCYAYTEITNVK